MFDDRFVDRDEDDVTFIDEYVEDVLKETQECEQGNLLCKCISR